MDPTPLAGERLRPNSATSPELQGCYRSGHRAVESNTGPARAWRQMFRSTSGASAGRGSRLPRTRCTQRRTRRCQRSTSHRHADSHRVETRPGHVWTREAARPRGCGVRFVGPCGLLRDDVGVDHDERVAALGAGCAQRSDSRLHKARRRRGRIARARSQQQDRGDQRPTRRLDQLRPTLRSSSPTIARRYGPKPHLSWARWLEPG